MLAVSDPTSTWNNWTFYRHIPFLVETISYFHSTLPSTIQLIVETIGHFAVRSNFY